MTSSVFNPKQHSENSSLREIIVEHQFVGAALKMLWSRGVTDAEILRSEFDGYGYDLVVTKGDVVRHVQLKSGLALKPVSVSRLLAEKPSGCVVFIQVNDELDIGPYFWFGGDPGTPLPDVSPLKTTKRTTPNSAGNKPDRAGHRDVPTSLFSKLDSLEALLIRILGTPSLEVR